jgi:MFS family permease
MRLLPNDTRGERSRLDLGGASLVTASIAALIFGLSEGQQQGFGAAPAVAAILLAGLLAIAFVVVERRVAEPMLPLGIFADRPRRAALVAVLVMGAVLAGYLYSLTLYMQNVLHYSAVLTGVALVPATVTVMVVSMLGVPRLLPRAGVKRMLLFGLVALGLGQLWLSQITASGRYPVHVLPGLLLTAFGIGLALPTASVAVTAGVDARRRGLAGGLYVAAQQIGVAAGLAALATVAADRASSAGGSAVAGYRLSFLVATGLVAIAAVNVVMQMRSTREHGPATAVR